MFKDNLNFIIINSIMNFAEFDDVLNLDVYEEDHTTYLSDDEIPNKLTSKVKICIHSNTSVNEGNSVCNDCGVELYNELSLEQDWRYYGESDNKNSNDPSRCHMRKKDEKTIYKDIEQFKLPKDIMIHANAYYNKITCGKIRRGAFRKTLIFACVFNAYKYTTNNPQPPEELQEKFKLTKKELSKGLTEFNMKMKKTERPVYISPNNFIPRLMQKFDSSQDSIDKVNSLYDKIANKSVILNRANPMSVISGLIYYYFKSINKDISCSEYCSVVKLSDITIQRISKEISSLLNTKDTVKLN